MRRILVSALAVPALLLAGCGGDEPTVEEPGTDTTQTEEAAAPPEETDTAEDTGMAQESESAAETEAAPPDAAAESELAPETEAPPGDAAGETAPGDAAGETAPGDAAAGTGPAPGGAEGQAAAQRTKEFFVAFTGADPQLCQLIVNMEGDAPMNADPADVELCETVLIPQLEGVITPDVAEVIDLIEVNGATIEGDTATVGAENFNELFAQAFGDQVITLQNFDGEWFVDLDNSFQR